MQSDMDYNKKMTGNTCPDIYVKLRPYDIKDQKEIFYGKNQLYFIDLENIKKNGQQILFQLEDFLEKSSKNKQIILPEDVRNFTKDILKNLKNKYNLPIEERIESLNKLLMKNNIPKDFKMPLFVPIKKAVVEDLPIKDIDVNHVPLDQGHLDHIKTKKAIMGILDAYDSPIKTIIQQATNGSIQFNIPQIEEVN